VTIMGDMQLGDDDLQARAIGSHPGASERAVASSAARRYPKASPLRAR
jgi:hypothetical protein